MEMRVPYCVDHQVSKEGTIWKGRVDVGEVLRTYSKHRNVENAAGSVMADHIHPGAAILLKHADSDFAG